MEKIQYKLEVFEGPMDLLLQLISKKKLSINDVPIMEIIEQYLDYVRQMQQEDLEVSSEFLEMAARLLYIKTVSLLPVHEEAEKLVEELRGELTEYQDCKRVANQLREQSSGFDYYSRPPEEFEVDMTYPRIHEPFEIFKAYIAAVGKGKRRLPPPIDAFRGIVARKIVSVASRVSYIIERFKGGNRQKFSSFFEGSESRSEMVATFLALLAMVKAKRISVDGQGGDSDVTLLKDRGERIEIDGALWELQRILDERKSGVCLLRLGSKYQLCSRIEYAQQVRSVLDIKKNAPLSAAALEVLAVVAYNQPVTKAYVEQIRGVDCSGVISTLCQKGLLEEKGRLELPGRPLLYGTTPDFLRCFCLSSLADLPELPDKPEVTDMNDDEINNEQGEQIRSFFQSE